MLATVVPGLAPLVSGELGSHPAITVTGTGFDGRSDVVLFDVGRGHQEQVSKLRTVEDLFVEVGRTLRADGDRAHWIAGRIWRPRRVQCALSVWAEEVRPLSASMTFRVIARVLQERSFLRTELRRQVERAVTNDRPKWRVADPSQIEIWVSEYVRGRLIAGIRLTDARMRQHKGRQVERPGALRPTVAAMMVALAGETNGALLDPCCGSGTILGEALAAGWRAAGRDIDPEAVEISRANVPGAEVEVGDARDIALRNASVAACVSNLPFGKQFTVQEDAVTWLEEVLAGMARVTRPGGRIVLLRPEIPRTTVPRELRLRDRHRLRLLGTKTTLWVFERT
ncbi:MAG: TRM11 family SAM-dependent methyltransferase [Streptosporangiaceae bacterium]